MGILMLRGTTLPKDHTNDHTVSYIVIFIIITLEIRSYIIVVRIFFKIVQRRLRQESRNSARISPWHRYAGLLYLDIFFYIEISRIFKIELNI